MTPNPYDTIVDWPILNSDWHDDILPFPDDIPITLMKSDERFTQIRLKLGDLQKVLQFIEKKKELRRKGNKSELEKLTENITNK
jgi:hypothetical protein